MPIWQRIHSKEKQNHAVSAMSDIVEGMVFCCLLSWFQNALSIDTAGQFSACYSNGCVFLQQACRRLSFVSIHMNMYTFLQKDAVLLHPCTFRHKFPLLASILRKCFLKDGFAAKGDTHHTAGSGIKRKI